MSQINPIIPGFAPDPSIVRVEDTYYLINSTFHFFPGLPIYSSKDLVTWKHVGNALNRSEQVSLRNTPSNISRWDKTQMVGNRGLYAPTIRFHKGTFYIICTNVEGMLDAQEDIGTHFILSTADICSGDWGDPVFFDFPGGDPSLYFEDDRAYVQIGLAKDFSIQQFEIDIRTGKQLSAPQKIWEDLGRKWTESPHVYRRDGFYYLLVAESGTFEKHTISVGRSRSLWGPYESHPGNPILTAFGTDNYIQHVGHGDFVEDTSGNWWMACLGVRKSKGAFCLGRETFLTPVQWLDDWPVILPVTVECISEGIDHQLPPRGQDGIERPGSTPQDGEYLHIRHHKPELYNIQGTTIKLRPGTCDLSDPLGGPSFVGRRQRYLEGTMRVQMDLPKALIRTQVKAGLALYKDELRYIQIFYDTAVGKVVLEAVNKVQKLNFLADADLPATSSFFFTIQHTELEYNFSYRPENDGQDITLGTVKAIQMSDLDFTGLVVGVFAVQSEEDKTACDVRFTNLDFQRS